MHIFRHKVNGKLYMIEHTTHCRWFFNGGAFEGIDAFPYQWQGESITFRKGHCGGREAFWPIALKFVEDNFVVVAEVHKYIH